MIEVVNLDLLHGFVPLELRFRVVPGRFRFASKIVQFIAVTRYPVGRVDERLKFMDHVGWLLFTRVVRSHFGVVRALSLLQLYLVHLVLLAAVHVPRPFPLETTPERSRRRCF